MAVVHVVRTSDIAQRAIELFTSTTVHNNVNDRAGYDAIHYGYNEMQTKTLTMVAFVWCHPHTIVTAIAQAI